MEPSRIRVVLHRPSSADNIGAVARAMKNLGLGRLAIVAPPSWSGRPRSGCAPTAREDILARARRMARRASDLLEAAEIHSDLRSALGEATWVCGTTSRVIEGRPRLAPHAVAAEAARRSESGLIAIVFGEERRGLSDRELELCQAICTIPTSRDYDSMNLAQAVAIISYELSLAAGQPSGSTEPLGEPARHATTEALWKGLTSVLARVGYLNPQNPQHILGEWRRLLARAEPTQREVELLLAAVRAVDRVLGLPATERGG
jgi:tRNA/rRNA methyltransferase